jgi:hypothetical protein
VGKKIYLVDLDLFYLNSDNVMYRIAFVVLPLGLTGLKLFAGIFGQPPRSDRACVFTDSSIVKLLALRNRVELLRNYVAYPYMGMQRVKQDGGNELAVA